MKKYRHFEDVLKQVGSLGRFQWATYALMQYSMIFQAFNQNMMAFGKMEPPWICSTQLIDENDENYGSRGGGGGGGHKNNGTSAYEFESVDHCHHSSANECHVDWPNVQFRSLVLEWRLYCDLAHVPITIISIQMLGLIPGSLFFNHLIDNYGRKRSSHLLNVGVFLLGLSSAFAWNWQIFAVLRFLIGFLFGGLFMVTIVLQMEVLEEKDRSFIYALDFWSIGNGLVSVVAYATGEWRRFILVSNCLCVPMLFLWFGVQESPRWLLQQGRVDEAYAVLKTIAKWNRRSEVAYDDLVELAESTKKHNPRTKVCCPKQHNICHVFASKRSSIYFLTLAFGWLTCSCMNYGLLYDNTSWAGNPYLNFVLANAIRMLFQFLFVVCDRWMKVKRRLQYLIPLSCIVIMITSVTIISMFEKTSTSEFAVTTIGLISTGAIGLLWLMICILPVELFPTVIRHIALGGCSVAARIGGVLGPQLLNMKYIWRPIPFLVFAILGWINLLTAYAFIPETRDKPLLDSIYEVIEDENSTEQVDDYESSEKLK